MQLKFTLAGLHESIHYKLLASQTVETIGFPAKELQEKVLQSSRGRNRYKESERLFIRTQMNAKPPKHSSYWEGNQHSGGFPRLNM